jgi:hypothetical protein
MSTSHPTLLSSIVEVWDQALARPLLPEQCHCES